MKQHAAKMHFSKNSIRITRYFLPVLTLWCSFSQAILAEIGEPVVSQTIESLLTSARHPLLLQMDFSAQNEALTLLYRMNANQLIWLGEDRPAKNRDDALAILSNAREEGLNPLNYDADRLRDYFRQATVASETALASYDVALSIALLRFAHDVHQGRVDPSELNYPAQFGAARPVVDFAELLKLHLQQQTVAELPQVLAPKIKQYQQLKQVLVNYLKQSSSESRLDLVFAKSLRPGEHDAQLPELRRQLLELGELTAEELAGAGKAGTLYDKASVAAVKRVQEQQGLKADGVIGKQTAEILNQSLEDKITSIELAMERLRWLPEAADGPRIIVNIPAFQLWAFKELNDQNPLHMKVIVGKSEENQTPMLAEEMKYLEFMPYWNIPKSIMDKEILPKLQTDFAYLANQDIELVQRYADSDGEHAEDVVTNLKHGRLRARQRPGAKNPLGRVKFIFPNKADVYLHDTPGKAAFNKDRRDLSHGCVRVADAEKLAEFVLGEQEGEAWDQQAIKQAMAGPKTQRVSLKKSIPVLFFYATAFVDQDNKPRFYPDIYGHDALLRNALNKLPGHSDNRQLISKNNVIAGG